MTPCSAPVHPAGRRRGPCCRRWRRLIHVPRRAPLVPRPTALSDEETAIWDWQLDVPGFSAEGQRRLRNATVLVTRVGGLGGPVAQQLCAAGVGKIILVHGGNLKPSDLNRQIIMHHDGLGAERASQAAARLRAFNPLVDVVAHPENISPENAEQFIDGVDVAVDAAPLFNERMALQAAAWKKNIPVVEAAMFATEAELTVTIPGETPCLRCLTPSIHQPGNGAFRYSVPSPPPRQHGRDGDGSN